MDLSNWDAIAVIGAILYLHKARRCGSVSYDCLITVLTAATQ